MVIVFTVRCLSTYRFTQAFEAANGQEAVALWQTHRHQVDLLLSDMVMLGGITGLELAERLRGLKPELAAIITSGYSAEIVQSRVPNKAGVVYLPKPYETKTLAKVIRQCLDRRAGAVSPNSKN